MLSSHTVQKISLASVSLPGSPILPFSLLICLLETEDVIKVLTNSHAKAVFFPHHMSANIAQVIVPLKSIENWVVIDSTSKALVPDIAVLNQLLDNTDTDNELRIPTIYDDEECLVFVDKAFKGFPVGCSFSQKQLIAMAMAWSELFAENGEEASIGVFLPDHSLALVLLGFIAPLINNISITFFRNPDPEKMWDYVKTQEIVQTLLPMSLAKLVNKRATGAKLGLPEGFTLVAVNNQLTPLKEFQTLSTGLQVPIHYCFSRLEAGGVISRCIHFPGNVLNSGDIICVGEPLSDTKITIVDATGASLPEGQKGMLQIEAPRIMLSYGGTSPGNDLHLNETTIRTDAQGFLETTDGKMQLYIVDEGGQDETSSEVNEPAFENTDDVVDAVQEVAPQIFSTPDPTTYTKQEVDTDYGRACINEIMDMATLVNDAESFLQGSLSALCYHSEFERGLIVEIFRNEKRFSVIANEGFDYMIDSSVPIEDQNSIFLSAHGVQNSFSTRRAKSAPFGMNNYAFSYLPTQRKGIVALYCDLPSHNIMPFPERRILEKQLLCFQFCFKSFNLDIRIISCAWEKSRRQKFR